MSRLVLHVLASDERRGAQAQARLLVDELNRVHDRHHHEALTLFAGPDGSLRTDVSLAVPPGRARRIVDPRALARLRRLLSDRLPVAVVAHGSEPLKYLALAAPRAVPIVYHRIGIGGPVLRHPVRRLAHRMLVGRAAAVVAVSHEAARDLADLGAQRAVAVIPNVRDPEMFRRKEADSGPVRLLWLGAVVPAKRPEAFVEAVSALRAKGHPVRATIVGDGPMLDALRPRLAAAGINAFGPTSDPASVLARHDVLVFTSRSEGMPGVLIEAGLAGLAVVTTDAAGVRDVIVDGQTGFVVEEVDDLEPALRRLLADRSLVERFGSAGRRRCQQYFVPAAAVPAWVRVLDEHSARLPDFLVVGTMKSGTTTLFDWLGRHQGVQLPRDKEPNWFSSPRWPRGGAAYRRLFAHIPRSLATAEASVESTAPRKAAVAASRIGETLGDVPLVCVLRDPEARARSHYRHEVQRGRERSAFAEAVTVGSSYVATSRYECCVQPYVDRFGDQLLVERFEDLFGDDDAAWQRILAHLGLDGRPRPDSVRNVTATKDAFTPAMRTLWDRGLYRHLSRMRPPRAVRRLVRPLLLRTDGAAAALIGDSEVAAPPPASQAAFAATRRWIDELQAGRRSSAADPR